MFKVITRDYSEAFERWTDALNAANALKPECKSWLQDIRIFDDEALVWVYSRLHRYPQYIGAGTYDRLARLFIFETMLEEELAAASHAEPDCTEPDYAETNTETAASEAQQLELDLALDSELELNNEEN